MKKKASKYQKGGPPSPEKYKELKSWWDGMSIGQREGIHQSMSFQKERDMMRAGREVYEPEYGMNIDDAPTVTAKRKRKLNTDLPNARLRNENDGTISEPEQGETSKALFDLAEGVTNVPQAYVTEGIEALRGNPYNLSFKDKMFASQQRVPSDTFLKDSHPALQFAGDMLIGTGGATSMAGAGVKGLRNLGRRVIRGNSIPNQLAKRIESGEFKLEAPPYDSFMDDINKTIKKPLPDDSSLIKNIDNTVKESEDTFTDVYQLAKSKTPAGATTEEYLNDLKKRLHSKEGKRRAKSLGLINDVPKHLDEKTKFYDIPGDNGYHSAGGTRGIRNSDGTQYHSPSEIASGSVGNPNKKKNTINHEMGHLYQNILKDDPHHTYQTLIDKNLEQLELSNYNHNKSDTEYFKTGSQGRERLPYLMELQQQFINSGRHPHRAFTPDEIKRKHKTPELKEWHRVLEIMKPTNANYKLIADSLNKLPSVVGAAATANEMRQYQQGGPGQQFADYQSQLGSMFPTNPGVLSQNSLNQNGLMANGLGLLGLGQIDSKNQQAWSQDPLNPTNMKPFQQQANAGNFNFQGGGRFRDQGLNYPIIDTIRAGESPILGYDSTFGSGKILSPDKPLSTMTIQEIYDFQPKLVEASRGKFKGWKWQKGSGINKKTLTQDEYKKLPKEDRKGFKKQGTSAVGAGQWIGDTLKGQVKKLKLDPSTVFTKEIQDKMLENTLLDKAGFKKFLRSKGTEKDYKRIMNRLSQEWASMPAYGGKATHGQPLAHSPQDVRASLEQTYNLHKLNQASEKAAPKFSRQAPINIGNIPEGVKDNSQMQPQIFNPEGGLPGMPDYLSGSGIPQLQQGSSKSKAKTKFYEGALGRAYAERDAMARKKAIKRRNEEEVTQMLLQKLVPEYGVQDNMQDPRFAAPQFSPQDIPMVNGLQQGGNVNTTGYTPGTQSYNNPYNIIPSNNITMRNTPFPVTGIGMNTGQRTTMLPGGNYDFPGDQQVLEIPHAKFGKKIGNLFKKASSVAGDVGRGWADSMGSILGFDPQMNYKNEKLGNVFGGYADGAGKVTGAVAKYSGVPRVGDIFGSGSTEGTQMQAPPPPTQQQQNMQMLSSFMPMLQQGMQGMNLDFQQGGELQQQEPQLPQPVQTEKGEKILMDDGSIVDVRATKKHEQMDKDYVTDILSPDAYVASNHKSTSIKKSLADKVNFGYTPIQYKENGGSVGVPKLIEFNSLFGKHKSRLPAELAAAVAKKFPVTDRKHDAFAIAAREENKASRLPYLEVIRGLNDIEREGSTQQLQKGGPTQYQDGGDSTTIGSSGEIGGMINGVTNMASGIFNQIRADKVKRQGLREFNAANQTYLDNLGRQRDISIGGGIMNAALQDTSYANLADQAGYQGSLQNIQNTQNSINNNLIGAQQQAASMAQAPVNSFYRNSQHMTPGQRGNMGANLQAQAINQNNQMQQSYGNQINNNIMQGSQRMTPLLMQAAGDRQRGLNYQTGARNQINSNLVNNTTQSQARYLGMEGQAAMDMAAIRAGIRNRAVNVMNQNGAQISAGAGQFGQGMYDYSQNNGSVNPNYGTMGSQQADGVIVDPAGQYRIYDAH